MAITFPDTIRVEFRYTWDGQKVMNRLHFLRDAAFNANTLQELGNSLYIWWSTSLAAVQATTVSLRQIYLQDVSEENGTVLEYTQNLPASGGDAWASMPNNVTCAFALRTGRSGRSYNGRIYHVGLTEDSVTNSYIQPIRFTQMLDAYSELRTIEGANGTNFTIAVASAVSGGVERSVGVVTPVLSVTGDASVDSQRRRLPGRGA